MSELKPAQHFDCQGVKVETSALKPTELKPAGYYNDDDFVADSGSAPVKLSTPSMWWWRLTGVTLLAIVLLSVWQWGLTLQQSWQHSILQGALLSLISASLLLLLVSVLWRELKLWRRLARNRQWHQSAQRIRHSVQFGEAEPLCRQIVASLPSTPAITAAVAQWQKALQGQHSDEEQLQLFEHFVLSELDKQAQQLVYRAATDTSLAVAISPFALADMLLVLWRASRLMRELAQLYGSAIGQLRSLLLIKRLLAALLWAGGSELALDMASDVIGGELTAKLSARAGQGVIAGLLLARLGNLAQQQLRPLPAGKTARVSIKTLSGALLQRFNSSVQTKADS
ncbi:TIGR01620 family protein [Rheinheimera muenzenbergensis]|uniref:TIGR01620 family protein n=1 Tax=Rheinheimera muenzenbergensis TaxID=1193628 RepID=A0ABU8C7M5_9GAMM